MIANTYGKWLSRKYRYALGTFKEWNEGWTDTGREVLARRCALKYEDFLYENGASDKEIKAIGGLRALVMANADDFVKDIKQLFDENSNILGLQDHKVLEDGIIRIENKEDFILKHMGACPGNSKEMSTFVNELVDKDTAQYLQALMGNATKGISRIEMLCIQGEASNGKTTFLNLIQKAFGDYAVTLHEAALLRQSGKTKDVAIAQVQGARLVLFSETNSSQSFDESTLKKITGGDALNVNMKWSNETITFKAQCLSVLGTNDIPRFTGSDPAMKRRMRVVEFEQTFVDNPIGEQKPRKDINIPTSSIVAWLLEGAAMPVIQSPRSIEATIATVGAMDSVEGYAATEPIKGTISVQASTLYGWYIKFCKEQGLIKVSSTKFGREATKYWNKEKITSGIHYTSRD